HWESDEEANPLEVAKRETEEETGIQQMKLLRIDAKNPLIPLNIDSHPVPPQPRRDEPAHYHHDFRYAFVAADTNFKNRPEEVNIADVGWFELDDPVTKRVAVDITKLKQFGFLQN
ncbi:MAG: NUDIX domain-containing protein, partial [Candidatus Saccharimonadales bacterium]